MTGVNRSPHHGSSLKIGETKNIGLFCTVSENFVGNTIHRLLTGRVFEKKTNIGGGEEDPQCNRPQHSLNKVPVAMLMVVL